MTFNWKIPAVSSGGAFLLSLLIGLIGRVGFGTAFLRGMMWALLFGGIAFGVDYLLRRFLPELFDAVEGESVDGERTVDITLDEENPLHKESADTAEEIPMVDEANSVDTADVDTADVDTADVDMADADSPFEDSPFEDSPGVDSPFEDSPGVDSPEAGFDDDSEEVAELEQVEEAEEADQGNNPAAGETGDTLPNIDSVETTFAASGAEEQDAEQPALNIDALGIEEDPATVARAVRTFMNKDQEG